MHKINCISIFTVHDCSLGPKFSRYSLELGDFVHDSFKTRFGLTVLGEFLPWQAIIYL